MFDIYKPSGLWYFVIETMNGLRHQLIRPALSDKSSFHSLTQALAQVMALLSNGDGRECQRWQNVPLWLMDAATYECPMTGHGPFPEENPLLLPSMMLVETDARL